ncbi:hypothetical protein Spb1_08660 [Planctopirus ephydatiae]|uniref:Uncharacterized protein n=1 Tax=Planctopirus ephydatiae TaxID=2528019 RepID=A0A518GKA2_9PLAN|nr:hypothetical protein [Planctopirus ephydatiae]QDV28998.1 hypothetical protein Spb1_08660 [Planctopirus ephydatiae]
MTTPADSPGKGLMNFVVYGLLIVLLIAVFAQVVFAITALTGDKIDQQYLLLLPVLAPVVVGVCIVTSMVSLLLPPSKLRSSTPKVCSLLVVIQVILWAAS